MGGRLKSLHFIVSLPLFFLYLVSFSRCTRLGTSSRPELVPHFTALRFALFGVVLLRTHRPTCSTHSNAAAMQQRCNSSLHNLNHLFRLRTPLDCLRSFTCLLTHPYAVKLLCPVTCWGLDDVSRSQTGFDDPDHRSGSFSLSAACLMGLPQFYAYDTCCRFDSCHNYYREFVFGDQVGCLMLFTRRHPAQVFVLFCPLRLSNQC